MVRTRQGASAVKGSGWEEYDIDCRTSLHRTSLRSELIAAGVRVFLYLEDRERTFDSPTDKLLMSVTAFADETSGRGGAGRVPRNVRESTPGTWRPAERSDTTTSTCAPPRESGGTSSGGSTQAEAAIGRRLFALCADGAGLTHITKTLNSEGVPSPRAQRGWPQAWATISVRAVLRGRSTPRKWSGIGVESMTAGAGIASTLGRLRNECTWPHPTRNCPR